MKILDSKIVTTVLLLICILSIGRLLPFSNDKLDSDDSLRNRSPKSPYSLVGETFEFRSLKTPSGSTLSQLADTAIVIILTNVGCNPCYKKEIDLINSFVRESGISAYGIFYDGGHSDNKAYFVSMIEKVTEPVFPLYFNEYNEVGVYAQFGTPILLYIVDDTICRIHLSDPRDDTLSIRFFEGLRAKLSIVE